ncbi:ROK family protein [Paenibacillus sp. N1-5-1-14]|uniref:ROK family protein n=1 Tax=Paenibacillus radicibacter TaxID=2972488 RepID=UPI002158BECF|nr:ROK family protein [Paenibacillus radicibacter]MCR8643549.1 ROK family protein [Paenibacillus radicibacter]
MKKRNDKEIYSIIRSHTFLSKLELLELTTLTGSTLTRTLEDLCNEKLIIEAGFGESTGGRKPILYAINPSYAYVFGLEISRTFSMLVLYDFAMNKLDDVHWKMSRESTSDVFLKDVIATVKSMMDKHHITTSQVLGLGIGAVGPLDLATGTILSPLHFPASGWSDIHIRDDLERELGLQIVLDIGVNTAIRGEYWSEGAKKYPLMLYVHAGVGIRSSMLYQGNIMPGNAAIEQSIGQMIIQTDGIRLDDSGNYGSWESYVTIPSLIKRAKALLKRGRVSSLISGDTDIDQLTFTHLREAIKHQDPLAMELIAESASYFGIGLANMINLLHPDKIVLGGPLAGSDPLFYEICTRIALERTCGYPAYEPAFTRGNLGGEAITYGAAIMVVIP